MESSDEIIKAARVLIRSLLKDAKRHGNAESEKSLHEVDELLDSLRELNEFPKTKQASEFEEYIGNLLTHLREPCRIATTYHQLLMADLEENAPAGAETYDKFINDALADLNQTVDDLNIFLGIVTSSEAFQTVNTEAVAKEIAKEMAPLLKQHNAKITVMKALPSLPGQHDAIKCMFGAILDNGIKFNKSASPHVEISATKQKGSWLFSFSDNGVGIKPQYAEKIFQPFVRLQNNDLRGTGMGLALCKKIAERHKGKIWQEPAEAGGSNFLIKLPA